MNHPKIQKLHKCKILYTDSKVKVYFVISHMFCNFLSYVLQVMMQHTLIAVILCMNVLVQGFSYFDVSSCANGLEVTGSRKRFWNFTMGSNIPVLSDIFSKGNYVHAIFNVKKMMCDSCSERDWGELDWTCRFLGGNQSAVKPVRDPHGSTLIVSCEIWNYTETVFDIRNPLNVSISAVSADSSEVLQFNDLVFCMYPTTKSIETFKYDLGGCTSIKGDSLQRTPEWIVYHLLQGWQHFYVYVNENPFEARTLLANFVSEGLIDIIDYEWPEHPRLMHQQSAENSCLLRYQGVAHWVSMTDIDEFLQPLQLQTIYHMLKNKIGSVNISSLQFTSVRFVKDDFNLSKYDVVPFNYQFRQHHNLCISDFLFRASTLDEHHVKSIVQPLHCQYFSVHVVTLGLPYQSVDPLNFARLVHYKMPVASQQHIFDTSMCEYSWTVRMELKRLGFKSINVSVSA